MDSSTDRTSGDRGYVIAMVTLLLVPMIGFMALAIDVGAWYTQATKVQRAVDAAALAGVVWMPDADKAETVAVETISKHGVNFGETYDDGNGGTPPRWDLRVEAVPGNDFQLRVVLTDNTAPIFFGEMFIDNVDITRQAISEFVKPVPIGSSGHTLGIQCNVSGSNNTNECNGVPQAGYWLRIVGPQRPHHHGDYKAAACLGLGGAPCDVSADPTAATNTGFDPDGYTLAIDVPVKDQPVTVEIFSPGWFDNQPRWLDGSGNPTNTNTGVRNGAAWDERDAWGDDSEINTKFSLFEADGSVLTTPLHPGTEVAGCTTIYGYGTDRAVLGDGDYADEWKVHCTFTPTFADIYPLQVQTYGFPGAGNHGGKTNAYSVRAYYGFTPPSELTPGVQPKVYALDFMSIASRSGVTRFEIAEIDPVHAGKTLSLRLFDPGDGSGDITLTVRDPNGATPANCVMRDWDPEDQAPPNLVPVDDQSTCTAITRIDGGSPANQYNDKWLEIQIPLPVSYTCTDCYWSIDYTAPSGFGEGTTWAVSVLGDPVRIVG